MVVDRCEICRFIYWISCKTLSKPARKGLKCHLMLIPQPVFYV